MYTFFAKKKKKTFTVTLEKFQRHLTALGTDLYFVTLLRGVVHVKMILNIKEYSFYLKLKNRNVYFYYSYRILEALQERIIKL